MALLFPVLAALAFVHTFGNLHAAQSFPENNPELGEYQNEGACFPLRDTWYIMYRSFDYDVYFGGDPTCLVISASGPFENDSGKFTVGVGGTVKVNVTATLTSSPGYEVQNIIHVVADEVPQVNFNLTSVYTDCESCKVLRHSYADGGKGCSLWQPKQALGTNVTCCHFVYDLVCGTSTKYQLYDKC
ncbi:uncharacterized protein LOC144144931 [Haemaphysalis longicornis]